VGEVDRRSARRSSIERFGKIFSIARIGGGLRRLRSSHRNHRFDEIGVTSSERIQEVTFGRRSYWTASAKPSNFSCADQLSGRSLRSVDRNLVVSSGGWRPSAIFSTIAGARKAGLGRRMKPRHAPALVSVSNPSHAKHYTRAVEERGCIVSGKLAAFLIFRYCARMRGRTIPRNGADKATANQTGV